MVPGERVLTLLQNGIGTVETYFATLKAGGIVVPVNTRLAADEIAYMIADSDPRLVVVDPTLAEEAREGARLAGSEAPLLTVDELRAEVSDDLGDPRSEESDTAFLMYTSGTTGRPKGAMITHRGLVVHTFNLVATFGMTEPTERVLSGMPLFHIGGVDILLYPLMGCGGTIMLDSTNFSAEDVVGIIERERVTACFFVPTQADELCDVPDAARRAASLRRICWGASNAPASVVQKLLRTFPEISVFASFGQTEMSAATCVLDVRTAMDRLGSVGRPLINVEARIVDEDMEDVGVGQVGEIVYNGPTVMKGFWRKPAETAAAFAGGWFHSGDLCRRDEQGYVYVVDRKKDMIISGGENIYCAEVEAAIATHPKVRDVAVIGVPHERWVETPLAVVTVMDPSDPPTLTEIVDHTRARLARFKAPTQLEVVEDLPRNAMGKVQKFALRKDRSAGGATS
ncbi:fatty-acid--CoA ligase FadD5 [Pseudonocardia halophobica]|uniref:Long-chain-fatty-acid--CoA ligase n=1 Tax=Pseudonocardia halophobica TaxID=29401 RepID=A0A9W6KYZ4_9PSEU|nr:AMP-binding protein [Pseudonocardia halophobica]GLL09862.1 long-chain-fatty-acid--CoA ligase [Pseudonocardia halophobica]